MKRITQYLTMIVLISSAISCDYKPTVDEIDRQKQENMLEEAQRQTGMPGMKNYREKKLLKAIYEMRDDEKIINYAYLYSDMTGKLVFIGKCVGYGIPYATQYSNPLKVTHEGANYGMTLPQAEPNGLYMPSEARGTWVMLLDKNGDPHPVYIEPDVIVSPFPLN